MTHPLSASRALCLLGLSLTVLTARADADVKRPDVDTAALPAMLYSVLSLGAFGWLVFKR